VVDNSGSRPVAALTAAATTLESGPGGVRKASPEIEMSRRLFAPARSARCSSRNSDSEAPVCWSLKRMLSRASALAGIRLVVALPTSMVVISRLVGGK